MTDRAGHRGLIDLAGWALPIQERHLRDVLQASTSLAAAEDPAEVA